MAESHIPDGLTADYENTGVRGAIRTLQDTPDYERLAAFLTELRDGYLVVDVTGTSKKKSTHIRTIRSTKGQLLLPVFTSMDELRLALPTGKREQAKGAFMPAAEALKLINAGKFVAAQFNVGSAALVVLRKYIELVLSDAAIEVSTLEAMR